MARLLVSAAITGALWLTFCGSSSGQVPASSARVSITPRSRQPEILEEDLSRIHLRVDTSLVLIPVATTTSQGTAVTSLGVENFRIFEDGVEQKIASFSRDEAPLSVGLVFDASGSMDRRMRESAAAAAAFFRTANRGDEFFLVEFGERPKLAVPFTQDSDEIYKKISHSRGFGRTSLIDAVHLALSHMKHARNFRKALIILSDGGDNHSRLTFREIRDTLLESDVQLYAMGLFDQDASRRRSVEEEKGPDLLQDLAEQTGGRLYPVRDLDELVPISTTIGEQLRGQYLLGYAPTNLRRDGKYRRVRVNLIAPSGAPQIHLSYRRGYYAPSE